MFTVFNQFCAEITHTMTYNQSTVYYIACHNASLSGPISTTARDQGYNSMAHMLLWFIQRYIIDVMLYLVCVQQCNNTHSTTPVPTEGSSCTFRLSLDTTDFFRTIYKQLIKFQTAVWTSFLSWCFFAFIVGHITPRRFIKFVDMSLKRSVAAQQLVVDVLIFRT